MKAIVYARYGSADVLELRDLPTPTPADNEVLIKIHASTVTPVDCVFRSGRPLFARPFTGFFSPRNKVLGTELAGKVVAIGKDVTGFAVGDRFFGAPANGCGAHGEFICLPADGAVSKMPANLTFGQSAAICNGALTALPFLRDNARIEPGQKVLIIGAAGSIGTFAVQLARHFGAEVTGVCSANNGELVKSLGAGVVIDYNQQDFTSGDTRYDIIFDTVGKSTFSQCRGILAKGGVYLTTVPSLPIMWQMLWTSLSGGKRAIFAATGLRPAHAQNRDLHILTDLIEAGHLTPVIDRTYPMHQIAKAHRYVERGHKRGNVVINIQPAAAQIAAV